MKMHTLLKVLIGSRAHGVHDEDSDYDFRGVFVINTKELLKIGNQNIPKQVGVIDKKMDDTSWEIGKFLNLAVKCNPTILEVFRAPVMEFETEFGSQIQDLFQYVWNSDGVYNACMGYALDQKKKLQKYAIPEHRRKNTKFASAYIRMLYLGHQILREGDFRLNLEDSPIFEQIKKYRAGEYTVSEVIKSGEEWETELKDAYEDNSNKETDIDKVNEFLLNVREAYM